MKYESKSDTISVGKVHHRSSGLYSLKGINRFLHEKKLDKYTTSVRNSLISSYS